MRQPTIHQMREKKNHRGKIKEVERLQYLQTHTYLGAQNKNFY
jgi:hypothetical protein